MAWLALCGPAARAQDAPSPKPEQKLPDAPQPREADVPQGPRKNEGLNPAQAAAEATKRFGEARLNDLRDWERGWLTGPYARRTGPLTAISAGERADIYLQQTFTTPGAYIKRAFVAAIEQGRDSPSQWGQGWGAYGERYASSEGQFIAANSIASMGDWALKYDPLYDLCRCKGFRRRTRHAVLRTFLTYNETEREMRPQWAVFGGAFSAGLISTAWRPHPRNAWADGGYAVLGQAGYGALQNFFTEFANEINRKVGPRKR